VTVLLVAAHLASAQQQPNQAQTDAAWARLPGGGSRPFITDFSVTTGGVTTVVWSGAASAATSPPAGYESTSGRISAVVSPVNMCASGQAPAPGVCYASPNRVAVALGVVTNGALQSDFSAASVSPAVDTSSVFDLTVNLGAFSSNYSWSWVNGDTTFWNISAGVLHLRVRPVSTPRIDWTSVVGAQCCTCDVPSNCNVARAVGTTLGANLLIQTAPSVGLNPLAGAVFATRNAVMGSLTLNTGAGSLDYAMASAHLAADGSAMLGQLSAFLPASAVATVFPSLTPADAPTLLNVTRVGDAGSQASVAVSAVSASAFGSDGFLVQVNGATFSAPTYRVALVGGTSAAPSRARAAALAAAAAAIALLL